MSYEYGSDGLGIKNPFKVEGTIKIIRGVITFVVGIIILLSVPQSVQSNAYFGWVSTGISFVILFLGAVAIGKGIMQVVRFFVGRNAPTSLSKNFAETRDENENTGYTAKELEQMLLNRTNSTFEEPKGMIETLLHTLVPKLTFAPIPIRNIAQKITSAGVKTLIAVISMFLATFVIYSGLIKVHSGLVFNVFASVMFFYFLSVWYTAGSPINKKETNNIKQIGVVGFIRTLIFSVSIPISISYILSMMPEKGVEFVQKVVSVDKDILSKMNTYEAITSGFAAHYTLSYLIISLFFLVISALSFTFFMTYYRTRQINPETLTAEARESWEKDVNPREIFINLETIVMAKRRYKNIPNRSYLKFSPELMETSSGKGSYRGKFLQETQPNVEEVEIEDKNKKLRLFGTIFGQTLLSLVAVNFLIIYKISPEILLHIKTLLTTNSLTPENAFIIGEDVFYILNGLFFILLFATFGRLFSNLSHIYWAEIIFKSKLLYLNCEGTFNESRITMGKGVYDSAQSDNVIVKTSNTLICIASEIYTSTFVGVGSNNLELPRHIMRMKADSVDMNAIIDELKYNLDQKNKIASISSDMDIKTMSKFQQINNLKESDKNLKIEEIATVTTNEVTTNEVTTEIQDIVVNNPSVCDEVKSNNNEEDQAQEEQAQEEKVVEQSSSEDSNNVDIVNIDSNDSAVEESQYTGINKNLIMD